MLLIIMLLIIILLIILLDILLRTLLITDHTFAHTLDCAIEHANAILILSCYFIAI